MSIYLCTSISGSTCMYACQSVCAYLRACLSLREYLCFLSFVHAACLFSVCRCYSRYHPISSDLCFIPPHLFPFLLSVPYRFVSNLCQFVSLIYMAAYLFLSLFTATFVISDLNPIDLLLVTFRRKLRSILTNIL